MNRNALIHNFIDILFTKTIITQLFLQIFTAIKCGINFHSNLVHTTGCWSEILGKRICLIMKIWGIVIDKIRLDLLVIFTRFQSIKFIQSRVQIIEQTIIIVIDVVKCGVEIIVKDIVSLYLSIWSHHLSVFGNIWSSSIQNLQRLTRPIVNFIIYIESVLGQINIPLESVSRQRNVNAIVDLR